MRGATVIVTGEADAAVSVGLPAKLSRKVVLTRGATRKVTTPVDDVVARVGFAVAGVCPSVTIWPDAPAPAVACQEVPGGQLGGSVTRWTCEVARRASGKRAPSDRPPVPLSDRRHS